MRAGQAAAPLRRGAHHHADSDHETAPSAPAMLARVCDTGPYQLITAGSVTEHFAGQVAEQRAAEGDDDRKALHQLEQQRAAEDDQRDADARGR
jgi:hypothetical protein